MVERINRTSDVFGVSRDLPLNYVERNEVDNRLVDNVTRDKHVIIYGGSKQGKTSLRKHCLSENDYVLVQCQNTWDIAKLSEAILKAVGFEVETSHSRTTDGKSKIQVKASGSLSMFGLGKVKTEAGGEHERGDSVQRTFEPLQLDPSDPNDLVRALRDIDFDKLIILEDFHYLPQETQQHFAFALKTIHEVSKYTFIIVAVWREENRLILYNGDLAGRVISVDADSWSNEALLSVIEEGEKLLNISFSEDFKTNLIEQSLGSVYIVQDCCYRACKDNGVHETVDGHQQDIPEMDVQKLIGEVIAEQGSRYSAFLTNLSLGFQDTQLEMYKWILYPILAADLNDIRDGLSYRSMRTLIQSRHPQGSNLNPGNLTQALTSLAALQSKKNVKPFILDYDQSNLRLSIVDKGFLLWLTSQDRNELLDNLGLPSVAG